MFGKKPQVKSLALRRQLLVAESDLNRAELLRECRTMADGAGRLADRAISLKTVTTSMVSLAAGIMAFSRGKTASAAKPSWFQKIVGGARVASTLWLAFRARGSSRVKK